MTSLRMWPGLFRPPVPQTLFLSAVVHDLETHSLCSALPGPWLLWPTVPMRWAFFQNEPLKCKQRKMNTMLHVQRHRRICRACAKGKLSWDSHASGDTPLSFFSFLDCLCEIHHCKYFRYELHPSLYMINILYKSKQKWFIFLSVSQFTMWLDYSPVIYFSNDKT